MAAKFYLGIFSLLFILIHPSNAADFTSARREFRLAWEALTHQDFDSVAELLPNLEGHPLYGYLVYGELNARLENAADDEIKDFLKRYKDLPVATQLRTAWLKRLAAEERWADFFANYVDTEDIAMRCLHARAKIGLRDQQALTSEASLPPPEGAWMEQVRALWMINKRQPAECENLFRIWQEAGGMTPADLWQRITLLFEAGSVDYAEELGARLPANERIWVRAWARIHRNPRNNLDQPLFHAQDNERTRMIIGHGLSRLARDNSATAMNEWRKLKAQYSFTPAERNKIDRAIALRAATNRDKNALPWLEAMELSDAEIRRARVRTALWAENWPAVVRAVRELKPWERNAARWRYWEARALEKTNQLGAMEIYRDLAGHRGYHSFLAADRLGITYAFNHRPIAIAEDEIARIERRPGFLRAHEWFILGYFPEGRREWMAALTGNSPEELITAAQLAAKWNWPDRIIATLGKTLEEDDLILRFPLAYQELIKSSAAIAGISPATVFAVTRQESIFMPDVRSAAGALGLMQLMPATAAQIAQEIKSPSNSNLLEPNNNLRLGSAFLAQLIRRFGNLTLAAAAYNAGPGRIQQWRPHAKMPADVWIESIPFDETRRYVRNILTYKAIYGWRLGLPQERLSEEMPSINP